MGIPWRSGVAILAVGTATACEGTPAVDAPPPPAVTVSAPVQRDVVPYDDFTGRTEAIRIVEIRARIAGTLDRVHFSPSVIVRRDEMLFSIDQAPYLAARRAAVADVRTVEAELARARSDLARLEQAIQTNAVSAQEVDRARADVAQAEAHLLGAEAGLEQADLDLAYTEIRSPISGMVGRNLVDAGNLVGSGENTLLTTVMQRDPMYAYFEASEAVVLNLLDREGRTLGRPATAEAGPPVFLGVANEVGWPHEGSLNYIDNTVDSETGTIQIRGTFPNPDGLLFPGLFARIRVPGPVQEGALLVSPAAIGTDLGGKYLLLVGDDNIVELRHVEVGALDGELRVITSGLGAHDRYIVNGLQRARPGLPVTPTEGD